MARLATTGFEVGRFATSALLDGDAVGNFTSVTGATQDTTTTNGGGASLKIASGNVVEFIYSGALVLDRTYFARLYFRKTATPTAATTTLWRLRPNAVQVFSFRIRSDGTVAFYDAAATVIGSASAVLADNTWYRMQASFVIPTVGNGTVTGKLATGDGSDTTLVNAVSTNLNNTVATPEIRFGAASTAAAADMFFDDFAFNDNQGSVNNTFPGAGHVRLLAPVADVSRAGGWQAGAGATTNMFDAVDNIPPVGAASTGTDTSQIGNAANETGTSYVAECTDYTTASITDTSPAAIQGVFRVGADSIAAAFPTIPDTASSRILTSNLSGTTQPRTSPDLSGLTKNSGDLLIAICVAYQSSVGSNAAFSSWTAGWTEFGDRQASGVTCVIGAAYKWSTGSETGTISVTQAATVTGDASWLLLSIPGAHASTPPEMGTAATGTGAAAPPSYSPSWGADNTLWIPVNVNGMTNATGSWTANTAAPTNYTGFASSNPTDNSLIGQVGGAVAFRQLNAASEAPGAFGQDTTNARNTAALIAVRPPAADNSGLARLLSNPADAGDTTINFSGSGAVAGADTTPAGWRTYRTAVQEHVSVTLGTRSQVRITKNTASTRNHMADLMGVMVDYDPTAVGGPPPTVPNIVMPPMTHY